MDDKPQNLRPIRTLRQHLWQGVKKAQRRRPLSFYLLLSIPVVLLLAVDLFRSREDPQRFVFGLSILFVFLGAVLIGALLDMLTLFRETFIGVRRSYRETLGDEEFLAELRARRASGDE